MKYIHIIFIYFFVFPIQAQFLNKQIDKLDVQSYHFNIKINDSNDTIYAKALIRILFLKDINHFKLDFDSNENGKGGMKIDKILLDNQPFNQYKVEKSQLVFLGNWKNNHSIQLEISYHGIPKDGLYISKNKFGNRTFFGDNWPNRAHFWLPVLDHPSDKALVGFTITAPEHYDVVASGEFISRIKKKNNIIWDYQSRVPFPTKVMVFGAADFSIKNYGIYHNIPVSGWIYKNFPIKGLDDYQSAVEILKFYDSLIGSYSYKKLANVQSKTQFGGMENAGNIFYYENSVDGKSSIEKLIAHEVAHQWFGNSVTEKNWSDIWLSEGFATYLTDLYIEHKYGKKAFEQRMKMERDKIRRYNLFKRNPIVYTEKIRLFNILNPNSYEKGAWVLHMLRQKVGDDIFFEILRKFYKKYRNKNASTENFIQLSEQISGQRLDLFFNQWLNGKSIPKLKIKSYVDQNDLIIEIEQMSEIYHFQLPVQIIFPDKEYKIKIPVNKKKTLYKVPMSKVYKTYQIIPDPDVQLLFINE